MSGTGRGENISKRGHSDRLCLWFCIVVSHSNRTHPFLLCRFPGKERFLRETVSGMKGSIRFFLNFVKCNNNEWFASKMIYISKVTNRKPLNERTEYPYNIAAIRHLEELKFNSSVTFIIGENGAGKSTLVEAIAVCAGFNPEGGSTYLNYRTYDTHSDLYKDLRLTRSSHRNKDGYFLRAESFYNVASEIDRITDPGRLESNYGGALHERSHGESFMGVILNRLSGNGLYILDEPESALSVTSLFKMIVKMNELERMNSQFIIATHSPILLAYPGAEIYEVTEEGLVAKTYEETEPYLLTRYFMFNHAKVIHELLNTDGT